MTVKNADATGTGSDEAATAEPTLDRRGLMVLGAGGLLFGVTPNDPLTLVGVAAMMVLVGLAACWLPALRAAKIDPAVAIRRQ